MTKHLRVLFSAFPIVSRNDEMTALQTYFSVLEDYSLEAIGRSVRQFITGNVSSHDGRFAPSAAELARNARQWDEALKQVEAAKLAPPLASGILSVDFGNGKIDMTKLTLEQQDTVLRTGKAPHATLGPTTVKLQRMSDQKRGFHTGDPIGHEDAA